MASRQDSLRTFEAQAVPYARFGRVLKFNRTLFLIQLLVLTAFFEAVVLHLLDKYFEALTGITRSMFKEGHILEHSVGFLKIKYFAIFGRLPTAFESFTYLVLSGVFLAFLLSRFNRLPRNFTAWLIYVDMIYLVSSIYFVLFGERFPYTVAEFGRLYFLQQTGVFLLIPVLLGMTLSVYTFGFVNFMLNFLTIALTLFYAFIFGAVRYLAFLSILQNWSYIHMPAMFFVAGPLLDTVYVVSFYSLCSYLTVKLLHRKESYYQWGY